MECQKKKDKITINDWNQKGWGRISYDFGFAMSSNIGVANLLENVITKKELSACYQKFGFGNKTGMTLNGESSGNISFTYDVEAAVVCPVCAHPQSYFEIKNENY